MPLKTCTEFPEEHSGTSILILPGNRLPQKLMLFCCSIIYVCQLLLLNYYCYHIYTFPIKNSHVVYTQFSDTPRYNGDTSGIIASISRQFFGHFPWQPVVWSLVDSPTGWWLTYPTPLKNDGVSESQWEGWHPFFVKWKIKFMFETTNQPIIVVPETRCIGVMCTNFAIINQL